MPRRPTVLLSFAIALPAAALAAPEAPASTSPLARQISDCRKVSDRDARLECYDRAAADLERATSAGDVVILEREDIRKTRRSLFGFNLPKIPFLKDGDDSGIANEINGTVAGANPGAYGRWTLTLDDGAVWQTTEVLRDFIDPEVGDKVRIRRAALGSYLMNVDGRRAIRVQRVK